jgi:putative acyl-CoA dehydrogenase
MAAPGGFRMSDPVRAIANQVPRRVGLNLFEADSLLAGTVSGFPDSVRESFSAAGAFWGSEEAQELARLANRNPPVLERYDPQGRRIDEVAFHPAYHALMQHSAAAGLHCSSFGEDAAEAGMRHRARAIRLFVTAQTECGHLCPMTMTNAAQASLRREPALYGEWHKRVQARAYDPSPRSAAEKHGATLGMGMTERQGGTDVRANVTRAEPAGEGYRIFGHKWFFSAPMSDAFLILAQAKGGLTCFLLPRFLPDGTRNALRLERLKDKLGNRSNASAEVEFDGAYAERIGKEGRGIPTILDMVGLTRLDCAVASAGLMRAGLAEAIHHARHRNAFGKALIDQKLMLRVLSDMALDLAAATALSFRLAEAFDRAADQPQEAAYARVMTPVVKYWICKSAPAFLHEAMECLGGNGYVEESALPRLYREAPVNAIWEGSGNVMALDAVRAIRGEGVLENLLEILSGELGRGAKAATDVLAAAAAVALEDEGSARIFVEQVALTAAAAALRRDHPPLFADAFIETRLGRPWRSTYGMLDDRFDNGALVDFIAPAVA